MPEKLRISSKSKRSKTTTDVNSVKIGFVSAGKIAESIINGLVVVNDKVDSKRIHFHQANNCVKNNYQEEDHLPKIFGYLKKGND